jgi:hypothetical protein
MIIGHDSDEGSRHAVKATSTLASSFELAQ